MTNSRLAPAIARPLWPLQVAVGALLGLKLAFFIFAPLIGDEPYYWLWGQRLALSYLDHPPLHAWVLALCSRLFGWNQWSLRAPTLVTLAGTIWVLYAWTKRLAPSDWRPWFWAVLAIYLASPLLFVMGSIAFNDHLLVLLCLASAHFFLLFVEDWRANSPRWGRLYLAAILLGLALLTKYNAGLLAIAYVAFVGIDRQLRPLFRRWQPYLAVVICVLLQTPVVLWNLTDGLASYRFHLSERWGGTITFDPLNFYLVLMVDVLALSPFLLVPYRRLFSGSEAGFGHDLRRLAICALLISTVTTLALSLIESDDPPYWNILAFPIALPLLAPRFHTRWAFWGHVGLGTALILVFMVNLMLFPISNLWGMRDSVMYTNYDWPQIADVVRAEEASHPGVFLAGTRYTMAAELSFALHDLEVTDLSSRHSEFSYWFDPAKHIGQNALVLATPVSPPDFARMQFHGFTLLRSFDITRFGSVLGRYDLYLGTSYCGGPCPLAAPAAESGANSAQ